MIVKCPSCQARYRLPDDAGGKKLKCKKCQQVFRTAAPAPAPPPPPATTDDDDLFGALASGEEVAREDAPPSVASSPGFANVSLDGPAATGAGADQKTGLMAGFVPYMKDVGKSALFVTKVSDVVMVVILVVMMMMIIPLGFAGCIGVIGIFILMGYYYAFLLNTVLGAANGEDTLPEFALGDVGETIVLPLVKFMASWLAALVPLFVGLGYMLGMGTIGSGEAQEVFWAAIGGNFGLVLDPNSGYSGIALALLLLSMAAWPMMILVVAVGGIPGLIRFDLMLMTVIKTLPAYILVMVLTWVSMIVPSFITDAMLPSDDGEVNLSVEVFAIPALLIAIETYAQIVTMRVIGLYYHHFKRSFAWDWG